MTPKRSLRILVAEDHGINQKLISLLLTGHQVVIAQNGQEALEQRQRDDFDVILMDIQMPVMDGVTATEKIRAHESATGAPRIPIIALTAHVLAEDKQRFLAAGMDHHIAKPIRRQELWALLDQCTQADTASE